MLASFLPLGRRSGDHAQLEVSVDSPLGDFLLERFDELWEHAVPLEDYMTVRLRVTAGGTQREYAARYVTVDGAYYLDDAAILAQLARERNRTVHAALTLEPARTYRVEILPDESAGLPDARSRFTEKYDHPAPVLIRLTPPALTTAAAAGPVPSRPLRTRRPVQRRHVSATALRPVHTRR